MSAPPAEPGERERGDALVGFARERLGPASACLISAAGPRAQAEARLAAGADAPDAVLAVVHGAARSDRQLADEFSAYLLRDLLRLGHGRLAPVLRRMLDTGDLVQSVLGDLGNDLFELRFESRLAFVSLLAQRLRWKATEAARRQGAQRRDPGAGVSSGSDEAAAAGPSPPSLAAQREEHARLVFVLEQLADRDRELLRLRLRGDSVGEIARALGLSEDAAKKAVQRAMARARELLG